MNVSDDAENENLIFKTLLYSHTELMNKDEFAVVQSWIFDNLEVSDEYKKSYSLIFPAKEVSYEVYTFKTNQFKDPVVKDNVIKILGYKFNFLHEGVLADESNIFTITTAQFNSNSFKVQINIERETEAKEIQLELLKKKKAEVLELAARLRKNKLEDNRLVLGMVEDTAKEMNVKDYLFDVA